ncbi:MAG: HNH endonuclease signature motif containing protein [Bdellovibrionota bacterium]
MYLCFRNWKGLWVQLDLELDHIVPFAEGGQHTVDNLRVLCRAHNQYLAEQSLVGLGKSCLSSYVSLVVSAGS